MPLVSLTINGFKSFADKINIDFNPGITGIVGPNGSGKSNVTEAIRWVMGESSAKSLRGDSMQDVIFGGSQLRAPLNRAEVTLVFDNTSKQLKTDAKIVEVTRRVFRNGDSDFLINKSEVRLKDIHQLFMDSGLSRDSFSIISQGRVEQIFNSRAENRRTIIEEAAGVLHFKQQKQTAASQLTQTTDNLIRISDLVNELKGRIDPLHEQSSLAKEYKLQKEQLDTKLQILTALEIRDLLTQKEDVAAEATRVNEIVANLDNTVNSDQLKLDDLRENLRKRNADKETVQAELKQVEQSLADLNTKLQIAKQSSAYDSSAEGELKQQIEDTNDQIEKAQAQLTALTAQKAEITATISNLSEQESSLRAEIKEDPKKLQQQLEQLRAEYIDALQEQTSNKNDLIYQTAELEKLSQPDNADSTNLQAEHVALLNDIANLESQIAKINQGIADTNRILTEKSSEKNSIELENTQIEQKLAGLNQQKQSLTAELESIEKMQNRHDGYYFGVKNILNNRDDFPGVLGTFSDLINFAPEYQDALSAALGSNVQNLVADSQKSAQNAIKTLKRRNFGRATFLPLDVLKFRSVSDSTKRTLEQYDGFVGVAADLVTADIKIANAVSFLLGNILVVENIDIATAISKLTGQRHRIVTLDGDILSPGGVMTGGAKSKNTNPLLENKARKLTLTQKLSALRQQIELVTNKRAVVLTKREQLESELLAATKTNQAQTDQQKELQFKLAQVKSESSRTNQLVELAEKKAKDLNEQKKILITQVQESEKKQTEFSLNVTKIKDAIEHIQGRIKNFDEEYEAIQNQLNKLLPEIAINNTNLQNINQKITESENNVEQLYSLLQHTNDRLKGISQSKLNGEEQHKSYTEQYAKNEEFEKELHTKLTELSSAEGKIATQISELEGAASRNYDLRKNAAIEQEQNSIKITKLDNQLDQRLTLLREDFSISYEAAIKNVAPEMDRAENRSQLEKEVKLHKLSLADIGNVNLDAIEEYESVKTRFDFLNEQQNDLLEAKTNLEKSMSELDEEVKTRFKRTFDQINQAFSEIFPKMFGGGHAKLVLTDPDDLLNTGLEIIAQPPGKKLQQLSLLSGGERALTAITLLFAILKVDPVPFCILDEVEASLDEANVVRFAKFLQNYDLTTQFIVITHRQGTMEQANQLYGVVMQESGISKVISVSLDEIRKDDAK